MNDRLYDLLPAIVRQRDGAVDGEPLRALLAVISGQVDLLESNIAQLYDDWFIETCAEWVVPYIGDLVGYVPVQEAGVALDAATVEERRLERIAIPRADVANTVRASRRKGTLSVLVELARDVAGVAAVAVEFDRLAGMTQAFDNVRPTRGMTLDVRTAGLGRVGGPFDATARTFSVRGPEPSTASSALPTEGIGIFVPRYRSQAVSETTAAWIPNEGDHCFTFSPFGNDVRLFSAEAFSVALERSDVNGEGFYGAGKSLSIRTLAENAKGRPAIVDRDRIVPADLSHWGREAKPGTVAVDAVLGRISFPPDEVPSEVLVTYHAGSSFDIGGGEYDRRPFTLPPAPLTGVVEQNTIALAGRNVKGIDVAVTLDGATSATYRTTASDTLVTIAAAIAHAVVALAIPGITATALDVTVSVTGVSSLDISFPVASYPVARNRHESHEKLGRILEHWQADGPARAVIEFADSEIYDEDEIDIELAPDQVLEIRAREGARPVIRMVEWRAGAPEPLRVGGGAGSVLVFDGLTIGGCGIRVTGELERFVLRHSTLVPGWRHLSASSRRHRVEPSLAIEGSSTAIDISRSILGPIAVRREERAPKPTPISVTDSIIDAFEHGEAIASPDARAADVELRAVRTTILGSSRVHAVTLAENTIFYKELIVSDRQHGCIRFCYVPGSSRTPPRYECVPKNEKSDVSLSFSNVHFESAGYAALSVETSEEVLRGADDRSEIGAFHDLFHPQRRENLHTRLAEFVPAGTTFAVRYVT